MTREEAIRHLNTYSTTNGSGQTSQAQHEEAKRIGIKALEQESVLDKIRAEIEEKYGDYDICEWSEDYDYEENDISEYHQVGKVSDILTIIDEYKAESEDKQ